MDFSPPLREFVQGWEKLRLVPYRDIAGNYTVGYGHLMHPDDDHTTPIDEDCAEALLDGDLMNAADAVNELVCVRLTQCQFDALTSFTFNLGAARLDISTLLKRINAGDYIDAGEQFLVWDKVRAGRVLVPSIGLAKRRRAERAMFVDGNYEGRP